MCDKACMRCLDEGENAAVREFIMMAAAAARNFVDDGATVSAVAELATLNALLAPEARLPT